MQTGRRSGELSRARSELLFAIATHWIAISAMWRFPSRTKGAKGSFSASAVPIVEVSRAVSAVRRRIIYASIAAAALALVFAYFSLYASAVALAGSNR